jgi:hypothetical protein
MNREEVVARLQQPPVEQSFCKRFKKEVLSQLLERISEEKVLLVWNVHYG